MENLKEEIHAYWTDRASGYSEYNRQELADERRTKWNHALLSRMEQHFPGKDPGEIKVLDIGTGPGFFAILLAEAGYDVTAVDATEEMLGEAGRNAGNLKDKICWVMGDAQRLSMADEQFDVLVTRNVTWNLPNPKAAYREWFRVLKKGGILLNFDADWYGYLFDEEKRNGYETDRRHVEEQQMEDYYIGTDIDKMEAIAREVPLSCAKRPQWDIETMETIGYAVKCEEEVWKEVWTEDEKVNYASTPMFLVVGEKQGPESKKKEIHVDAKNRNQQPKHAEAFCLCGVQVAPGERWSGYLSLAEGSIRLPAAILHGEKSGKTVLITAGVHAGEYVGIQAAIELSQKLKIEKVAGTIVIVKVTNLPAFEQRNGSMGLTDGKNLNRVFPGNPQGSEMERLAFAVAQELQPRADFYIDLHSGDDYEQLTPYVYYAGKAAEEVVAMSRNMAEQVDVPYMVKSNVASGGSYNYAASTGIPSILIERGGMGGWTYEEVRSTRRDVRNILCHLGVYLGQKDYRKYYPLEVADVCYQDASHSGCWYPKKSAGDMIRKGEVLGEVRDFEGKVLEVSVAEYDGVVLYQTATLQVVENGPMIAYGRILPVHDERKERIVRYWGKRSESFLEQRRAELHSHMADRWRREITSRIPDEKKLKILDVGCGTGFFAILMAKQGHEVTGTDLTPEMVENASILAKEEGVACEFHIMDAENLQFADESFDVILSRNLTWTLPDAKKAYKEWMRVLKKGGVLLNFDANYGMSNFTDNDGLPENHAHRSLGDDLMQECEEIKRQLPISSYSRPAWDLETLGAMKLERFSIDLGISSRIYLEKDEFYNPTPMFMLRVEK